MTDTTRHILPDDILMGYSAGALPQAFDLVVAAHVSISNEARARVEAFDAVGGAVLEQAGCAKVKDDSLSAVMAMIDGADPEPRITLPAAPGTAVLPEPVRAVVGGDVDRVEWRSIGLGVRQAVLSDGPEGTARLLSIPAGAQMPAHSHRGMEMTLVLQGAYSDESDRFARGDVELADDDTHHTPIAEAGPDCICLIATEGRLRFRSILPRIAQPFIGI